MKEIQPSINDAGLQAILDESRIREKQVSDSNKSIEALWHKLGELSDASYRFSCWREVLARDLKRQPSHDECCDRFELLVSELKAVVSQHGYEDFYQMIAESTAPNPEHHAACVILYQLLTSSNDESRTIINEIFGQDVPVCCYVFTALVPMLYGRWYIDYGNIRRLPVIATLDDLGFLGDMRAEGFSLLMRARPDFAEFREQLRKYRPPTEYNPDEIQRFIDELRADDSDLSQSLLNTPLQELAQLFAAGRKRDQERARLAESQLNVPSNFESADSAPAEPQQEQRNGSQTGLKPVPAIPVTPISSEPAPSKTKKGSTNRGDGEKKLIAALTRHHQYSGDSCLMLEPIGSNELAKMAKVAQSTASAFFAKNFKGHTIYKRQCNDKSRLIMALKWLNGEITPSILYKAKPIEHTYQDDDRDDDLDDE